MYTDNPSRCARLGLVVLLLAGSAFAQDQYQQTFGEYTVYYNLVKSTFLSEAIAERYDVERSEDNSLLTVSVRAPNAEGDMVDQPATVSGTVRDLVHLHRLDFREYQDPNAVYYLASVPTGSRTELDFEIDISPEREDQTFELTFSEFIPDIESKSGP